MAENMYECKSSNCNRGFDAKEYTLTNDKDKCILHCKKNDWYQIDDKGNRNWDKSQKKVNSFWRVIKNKLNKIQSSYDISNEISDYDGRYDDMIFPKFQEDIEYNSYIDNKDEQDTNFYSYGKIEERDIPIREDTISIFNIINNKFHNCIFLDNASFTRYHFKKNLIFMNCTFEKDVDFSKQTFTEKFKFVECTVHGKAKFNRTKFKNLVGFEKTNFNEVIFRNARFHKMVRFKGSTFNNNISFEYTYFFDESVFDDMTLNLEINLVNAIFRKIPSFLNIQNNINEKYNINVTNRETARIIKNSFEQINNIIDSNKFYALEMKEREKELEEEGTNRLEWLVFKIHGLSSNHSQDWLQSLFWILSFSFVYAFINCINESLDTKLEFIIVDIFIYLIGIFISILVVNTKKINNFFLIFVFYITYGFISKDFNLYDISNNINPFSIMTGFNELNFSTLIYKIVIAYLLYQLIISIRQNTRRK